jgi:hypothetical protein
MGDVYDLMEINFRMKKWFCLIIFIYCLDLFAFAQSDSTKSGVVGFEKSWKFNASLSLNFIPHDFFALPILRADKNNLHLEARYNYEDRETFSGWIGYNISGGNKLEYAITPMIGGVVGNSDGIAPGIEVDLILGKFELYSETEHFFDFKSTENNFFYTWTDFTYSPKEWLWIGISGQRTRVIQTDLYLQHGLLVGSGYKDWGFNFYAYNPFSDDAYLILSISKDL